LAFRQQFVNWHPASLACSIGLAKLSIDNIIGFLKVIAGEDAAKVQFSWPADLDDFDLARRGVRGGGAFSVGPPVGSRDIELFDKESILDVYQDAAEDDPGGREGA
jgi:hypothetical protein